MRVYGLAACVVLTSTCGWKLCEGGCPDGQQCRAGVCVQPTGLNDGGVSDGGNTNPSVCGDVTCSQDEYCNNASLSECACRYQCPLTIDNIRGTDTVVTTHACNLCASPLLTIGSASTCTRLYPNITGIDVCTDDPRCSQIESCSKNARNNCCFNGNLTQGAR